MNKELVARLKELKSHYPLLRGYSLKQIIKLYQLERKMAKGKREKALEFVFTMKISKKQHVALKKAAKADKVSMASKGREIFDQHFLGKVV